MLLHVSYPLVMLAYYVTWIDDTGTKWLDMQANQSWVTNCTKLKMNNDICKKTETEWPQANQSWVTNCTKLKMSDEICKKIEIEYCTKLKMSNQISNSAITRPYFLLITSLLYAYQSLKTYNSLHI